jgi:putative ABC transport system ATP-binding protein
VSEPLQEVRRLSRMYQGDFDRWRLSRAPEERRPPPSPPAPEAPLIEVRGLTKVYQMGAVQVRALDGVDLDIAAGEYVTIMGPSGSGKSTLMNLIGCLDTPTGGSYRLAGELVSELDDDRLADIRNRRIGFVFQVFNLLPRATALANVELPLVYSRVPPAERAEQAQWALEEVDLTDRMDHRPSELSGGQRQRVAIARALVTRPSILLADEPTGNLDSKTGVEIMHLFRKLHGAGQTIIVVTHDPDVSAVGRRVLHLHDGRLVREEKRRGPLTTSRLYGTR